MNLPRKSEPEAGKPRGKSTFQSLANAYREIGPYLNIGYFFVAAIGLLAFLGHLVDNHWGLHPRGIVVGAILGVIVGFYNFIKTVAGSSGSKRRS